MTPERFHAVSSFHGRDDSLGPGPFLITEAHWASVIGSLLSRNRLLQKGLQPPRGGGLFRASGVVGRWREEGSGWGGDLESCHPSEAGDRKNLSILHAAPNMVLGLSR